MSITGWLGMARFIRNQILMIRDRDYQPVLPAVWERLMYRIVFKNLLPYLVSVIMLRMALTIPGAIGSEVFITYIGLGLPAGNRLLWATWSIPDASLMTTPGTAVSAALPDPGAVHHNDLRSM